MVQDAASVMTAATAALVLFQQHYEQYLARALYESHYFRPQTFVSHLVQSDENCLHLLRMNVYCFRRFVQLFRSMGRLQDTIDCNVEEQVLKALVSMQDLFIKPPSSDTPGVILNNPIWMPYFKDCIGAIDGTHFPVKVPPISEYRFRRRKQRPSQNVLAACDFDLKFTYILAGWEGTAYDARVFGSAIAKPNGIPCLPGKYYLADAGYPLRRHFVTPYRGTAYHLNEIRDQTPQTARELFNHRHSSLHNVIERAFDVLKKRFNIINEEPMYSFEKLIDIVLACCCVHNHIRNVMPTDSLIDDVDRELLTELSQCDDPISAGSSAEDEREGNRIRTSITMAMWDDFQGHAIVRIMSNDYVMFNYSELLLYYLSSVCLDGNS
ncbi:uncharacterized protein LOC143853738 [Tasmannia lanceolata]|uniref:uncharacterized protein LOC143853738 n=1 Tax=Tasmannia lanceolata TaxID=3420 RepID=UPI0040633E72